MVVPQWHNYCIKFPYSYGCVHTLYADCLDQNLRSFFPYIVLNIYMAGVA